MVIWLIGISGAGKTTLGKLLLNFFGGKDKKAYLLDGDNVRNFFENDLGYTKNERMMNVKRIILGAHICDENEIIAIVANISPFEELRLLARRKIKNYNEIYLKKNIAVSMVKDVKGVYASNKSDIVGLDVVFDDPTHSDLVIEIDNYTEEEALHLIIDFITKKYGVI